MTLPLSKSVELRRMTMAFITGNADSFNAGYDASQAQDIHNMANAIGAISAYDGQNPLEINIGEGAAPLRFFMALAASIPSPCPILLKGDGRLPERPNAILVETLHQFGADIAVAPDAIPGNSLPLIIKGRKLKGGEIEIDCTVSSQYISALMMASVLWEDGLTLRFIGGKPVSMPYIRMTAKIMRAYGCDVTLTETEVRVKPGFDKDKIAGVPQEADWSAAAFLYEACFLIPHLRSEILNRLPANLLPPWQSLQGDASCVKIFGIIEIAWPYEEDILDMADTPDIVPPLAVALTLRGIPFTLSGIKNLRIKESDRIEALVLNLRKLGYILTATEDTLTFEGKSKVIASNTEDIIEIDSRGDHRIAMAFGIASLLRPEIRISHPECVAKSFPGFWQLLGEIKNLM